MASVGVRAETDDLRQYLRPPPQRVFALFENQRRRALPDDQSVAVAVKRPRSGLGAVVPGAGREQGVEDGDLGRTELLRAAGDHHVFLPVLYKFIGVADGQRTGRARRAGRNDAPGGPEMDRKVDARGLRHHLDVGRARHVLHFFGENYRVEIGERVDAAGGRAVGHPGTSVPEHRISQKPRLRQRLFGGVERHDRHRPHRPRHFAVVALGLDIAGRRAQPRLKALVFIEAS